MVLNTRGTFGSSIMLHREVVHTYVLCAVGISCMLCGSRSSAARGCSALWFSSADVCDLQLSPTLFPCRSRGSASATNGTKAGKGTWAAPAVCTVLIHLRFSLFPSADVFPAVMLYSLLSAPPPCCVVSSYYGSSFPCLTSSLPGRPLVLYFS